MVTMVNMRLTGEMSGRGKTAHFHGATASRINPLRMRLSLPPEPGFGKQVSKLGTRHPSTPCPATTTQHA